MNPEPSLPPPVPAAGEHDVLVVGGGINGAGIARDLAGRGLSVLLAEQDDLAAHTSSASTKLIHGGLRYLEHGELALVRKALAERERLLRSAPHLMRPLRFVMPHDPALRPAWLIRAGLFLYDHLARREILPGSEVLDLRRHPAGAPLKAGFSRGFAYSDGWVDDARLVVLAAVDAAGRGARIATRCRVEDVARAGAGWRATLRHRDGRVEAAWARALVNAAGPWAAEFLRGHARLAGTRALRLVKGSHIVVPSLFGHEEAYLFQSPDRRIVFAIPYEQRFTLIGTTDVEHLGPPGAVQADEAEIAYLCEQAGRYFRQPVRPRDVVWSYAGLRPLLDGASGREASAVTRDYALELDGGAGGAAPLLTVWGGKITTFRRLAEEAADRLCRALGERRGAWTAAAPLPGGDLRPWIGTPRRPDLDLQRFEDAVARIHPQLPEGVRRRWVRAYGSRIALLPGEGDALGREVAPGLFEAELHYLHRHEWARCAEDVLWRRSKLGLHLDAAERGQVARWCDRQWRPLADGEARGWG